MNFHLINTLPWVVLTCSLLISFFSPKAMGLVFLINLWALSYPHTLSTFSKKAFSSIKYKALGVLVFLSMLAVVSGLAMLKDLVFIMNIYFIAQFFHYIRQNYGISKSYLKNSKAMDLQINGFLFFIFLFTQQNLSFFQFKIWTFPVDLPILYIYFFHLSFVIYRKILLFTYDKKSIISFENIQYLLFSLFVFNLISFELVWIGINMVHNIQYLLLVNFEDHKSKFILFYLPIFLISFVLFKSADYINENFQFTLSVSFILVMALNFSHYIFDSFLWKRKYRN